jgi:hypothetical protein
MYERRHMGDERQFSMYVDGVLRQFSVSSYSKERFGWSDIRRMFRQVRAVREMAA